jgi:hypothetical protein
VRSKDLKNKGVRHILKLTPGVLGLTLITNQVLAQELPEANVQTSHQVLEQIEKYSQELNSAPTMGQVNSITQLRDVSPSDWAYDALRNLVENYDCIEGYPNRTYRGDRSMTRYEFAAGLSACLDAISGSMTGGIDTSELDQIRRLVKEFEAELATLGTRVDDLEGRVAFLEDNQFSTTTKLKGEAVFTLANQFGTPVDNSDNAIFANRIRLNLNSSFTGKDDLNIRLESGNFGQFNTATNMTRLDHDYSNGNDVVITDLWYKFPAGDNVRFWVGGNNFDLEKMVATRYNPYMESGSTGSLSRFLIRNPAVYRTDSGGQGVGANIAFSDQFNIDLAYSAPNGNNPADARGLFNGAYAAGAQLNWEPSDNVGIGFTYVHSYHSSNDVDLTGNTGTSGKALESGDGDAPFGGVPTSADRFGLQGTFRISDRVNLAGWGGYVSANAETSNASAEIWNWAANLSLLDLGKEGAVLNIGGGMLPRVGRTGGTVAFDTGTSYLVEANYKYPINKNIIITPGVYVVLDPGHNEANSAIWVGALRTTFRF